MEEKEEGQERVGVGHAGIDAKQCEEKERLRGKRYMCKEVREFACLRESEQASKACVYNSCLPLGWRGNSKKRRKQARRDSIK